jgi:hypothetical protein
MYVALKVGMARGQARHCRKRRERTGRYPQRGITRTAGRELTVGAPAEHGRWSAKPMSSDEGLAMMSSVHSGQGDDSLSVITPW